MLLVRYKLSFGIKLFEQFKVHFILNEMIMGGMVLETSLQEIVSRFHEQQKIAKSEVREKTINIYINIFASRLVHVKMSHLR